MKLSSGKRIGQSKQELTAAVFFSFFLHAIFVLSWVFLYLNLFSKVHVPLSYEVQLVAPSQPAVLPQTPQVPASPPREVKPEPKRKKAPEKVHKPATKKGEMPDLSTLKQKQTEQAKPAESMPAPAAKTESVAVATPQQDFKFGWYLANVRDKIKPNWQPLKGNQDATARVIFSINRSGWVVDVNVDNEHSTGSFEFKQAAIRAIRASNPFPPLPEEFTKATLQFSVDLIPEE